MPPHLAARAAEYGVVIEGSVNVDMKRVKGAQGTWSRYRQ
jgi:hypothetical protein